MLNLNEKYFSISERCERNHQNKFCLRPPKRRLYPRELTWSNVVERSFFAWITLFKLKAMLPSSLSLFIVMLPSYHPCFQVIFVSKLILFPSYLLPLNMLSISLNGDQICLRCQKSSQSHMAMIFKRISWIQILADCKHSVTRWYKYERLPKSDDFRPPAVESVQIIQSDHSIARWEAKWSN